MRKIVMLAGGLLICGSVMAETYYLHANMPNGTSPLDNTIWFTDPVGGVDKATDGGTFGGNRFDVNGKAFRTQSTTGTGNFSGELVVGTAGAGTMELLASTWNANAGMDINNSALMRLRRATVNLNAGDMVLGSSADLSFRTHTDGSDILNLAIDDLSGSGLLSFGQFSTCTSGVWGVSVIGGSFFGTMDLQYGQLTFDNAFDLGAASLTIDSAKDNSVVLANNVAFDSIAFGGTTLTIGSFTADQLNTEFGTDRFSGSGVMTIPEPATLGLIAVMGGGVLFIRRWFLI